jgi:hypothetical protein
LESKGAPELLDCRKCSQALAEPFRVLLYPVFHHLGPMPHLPQATVDALDQTLPTVPKLPLDRPAAPNT